jgi:predicted ATP-grasp superfamily ATP-dependent carboligase
MLPKVLVTDSSERAALAAIRSLGRRGIEVTAADSTSFNSGFLSKYCSHRVIYPPPHRNKRKFVDSILRFVKNEKFDLLIPVTDFTSIPIIEYKDEIEDYVKVAAPPYETAIKAIDKAQTIKIAQQHGIPCPKTFLVSDSDSLKEIAEDVRYPVVIKPRVKVLWTEERAIMLKVTPINYAYNHDDLIKKYAKISSQLDEFDVPHEFFLIQEFAKGEGYGVEVLMQNSESKALFVHKRLREYPITGGASTLRVSARNEKLEKYAVDLLGAMDWEGVAMVEFKLDESSGDAKLMEVNGRFWGSLPLAINAGIDFPYLLYKSIVEKNVDPCFSYRAGTMQRWLIPGDLLWLFASLQDNQRSKLRNFMKFIRSCRVSDDIISLSDMAPTFGAMLTTLRYLLDVISGNRTIHGESGLRAA